MAEIPSPAPQAPVAEASVLQPPTENRKKPRWRTIIPGTIVTLSTLTGIGAAIDHSLVKKDIKDQLTASGIVEPTQEQLAKADKEIQRVKDTVIAEVNDDRWTSAQDMIGRQKRALKEGPYAVKREKTVYVDAEKEKTRPFQSRLNTDMWLAGAAVAANFLTGGVMVASDRRRKRMQQIPKPAAPRSR